MRESVDITLNFLFYCRVLAQMPEIRRFVWLICSLQYLSTRELLVCLMLQQLIASFPEDCVQDVRNNVAVIQLVIKVAFWYILNDERKCSAEALFSIS